MSEDPALVFVDAMLQRGYQLDYILGLDAYEKTLHLASIMNERRGESD